MNTFAIIPKDGATRNVAASGFALALQAFYAGITSCFSSQYNLNQAKMDAIDLADPKPRIPFLEDLAASSGGLPPNTDVNLPPEVAMCITMKGATGSGVNPRRTRGRIYVGPLQVPANNDAQAVITATRAQVAAAFGPVMVGTDYTLCIYSRYTHHAVPVGRRIDEKDASGNFIFPEVPEALPASFTPVETAYIDDAWDTQRRRGVAAATRLALTPS